MTRPEGEAAAPSPRRLVAAAGPEFPDLHDDWPLLRAALARQGVDAGTAVWSDPEVDWTAYGLVLANGAWDHIHHVDEFLAWVDRVSGTLGVPVVNAPAVLRWNIDKRYLRDLEAAGVPIVPTLWVDHHESSDLEPPRRRDRGQALGVRRRVPDGALPAPRARPGPPSHRRTDGVGAHRHGAALPAGRRRRR